VAKNTSGHMEIKKFGVVAQATNRSVIKGIDRYLVLREAFKVFRKQIVTHESEGKAIHHLAILIISNIF
jgi:hypothetical protein